jgi:hypothetical protein
VRLPHGPLNEFDFSRPPSLVLSRVICPLDRNRLSMSFVKSSTI